MLLYIGKSTEIPESFFQLLEAIPEEVVSSYERPLRVPHLGENQKVVAVFDRTIYTFVYICDGPDVLADMQQAYDEILRPGHAFDVKWFAVSAVSFDVEVIVISD